MDQEIIDARAKLAERFGNTQIGGKGTFLLLTHSRRNPEKKEEAC